MKKLVFRKLNWYRVTIMKYYFLDEYFYSLQKLTLKD